MKKLSKTLLFVLIGLLSTHVVTAKKIDLPPYYTGVIDPNLTHASINKKNTIRTKPIRYFRLMTSKELDNLKMTNNNFNSECVHFRGVLNGAWRLPGVTQIKTSYEQDQTLSTLILRSYDAVFTVVVETSLLDNIRDSNGRLQAGETDVVLYMNGDLVALGADHTEDYSPLCV